MTQIFYIHGFKSSINSQTLSDLKYYYPDAKGLTYDFSKPRESVDALVEMLNGIDDDIIIVASSLGGWYAEQISKRVVACYVLYNPCINPELSLPKLNDPDVTEEALQEYASMTNIVPYLAPKTVIVSCDDELIDYRETFKKYDDMCEVIITSGGHRMTAENLALIYSVIEYKDFQITI